MLRGIKLAWQQKVLNLIAIAIGVVGIVSRWHYTSRWIFWTVLPLLVAWVRELEVYWQGGRGWWVQRGWRDRVVGVGLLGMAAWVSGLLGQLIGTPLGERIMCVVLLLLGLIVGVKVKKALDSIAEEAGWK